MHALYIIFFIFCVVFCLIFAKKFGGAHLAVCAVDDNNFIESVDESDVLVIGWKFPANEIMLSGKNNNVFVPYDATNVEHVKDYNLIRESLPGGNVNAKFAVFNGKVIGHEINGNMVCANDKIQDMLIKKYYR